MEILRAGGGAPVGAGASVVVPGAARESVVEIAECYCKWSRHARYEGVIARVDETEESASVVGVVGS